MLSKDTNGETVEFAETGSSAFGGCHRIVCFPAHIVSRLHLLCSGNSEGVKSAKYTSFFFFLKLQSG